MALSSGCKAALAIIEELARRAIMYVHDVLGDLRGAAITLCLGASMLCGSVAPATAATVTLGTCAQSGILVTSKMAANAAIWSICVASQPDLGPVLSQVTLSPPAVDGGTKTKILASAALSQVILTAAGSSKLPAAVMGSGSGLSWSTAAPTDCTNPAATFSSVSGGLCIQILPRGYAWRGYKGLVQGESLVISQAATLGGDVYLERWVFDDDGSIHPYLAVGTPQAPLDMNRMVTALWRLNFAIDNGQTASPSSSVEQFDYDQCLTPSSLACSNIRSQKAVAIQSGTSVSASAATQRFWRIKSTSQKNTNGWPLSYEILLHQTGIDHQSAPFDIAFTDISNDSCAIRTLTGPCSVAAIGGENLPIKNPVSWIVTTSHQLGSTQSLFWQGFNLRARDLTITSPLL